jgi:hypothetical protein
VFQKGKLAVFDDVHHIKGKKNGEYQQQGNQKQYAVAVKELVQRIPTPCANDLLLL